MPDKGDGIGTDRQYALWQLVVGSRCPVELPVQPAFKEFLNNVFGFISKDTAVKIAEYCFLGIEGKE